MYESEQEVLECREKLKEVEQALQRIGFTEDVRAEECSNLRQSREPLSWIYVWSLHNKGSVAGGCGDDQE